MLMLFMGVCTFAICTLSDPAQEQQMRQMDAEDRRVEEAYDERSKHAAHSTGRGGVGNVSDWTHPTRYNLFKSHPPCSPFPFCVISKMT